MAGATSPPQGIGEYFGLAPESTFRTAVTPTVFWRTISNSMACRDPVRPLSGPTGASVAVSTTRGFRGKPDRSGTVVMEADYDYLGHLFANAVDSAGSPAESPASVYTHTFNFLAAIPGTVATSFTCAHGREAEDLQYQGAMIDALEITAAEDSIVTVSNDIIASGGGNTEVAESIGTLSTAPFVEFHDAIFRADFGSTGTTLTDSHDQEGGEEALSWSFRIENGYRRQQATGSTDANFRGDRSYTHGGYRRAFFRVSRDYFDDNFFDQYHNSTLASAFGTFQILCNSDEVITGSSEYSLGIVLTAGFIPELRAEFGGGPDVIGENITIEAGYDGTNVPLYINLRNGTSATY